MTDINAKNELEKNLYAAQAGETDISEFMQYLLSAQVFMPIKDTKESVAGFQKENKAEPLIVQGEGEAGFKIMPVFSSPEKSKIFLENFNNYSGGLLVNIDWVLSRIGQNMGISINPDDEPGIDLDPATIEQLVTLNASMENTKT